MKKHLIMATLLGLVSSGAVHAADNTPIVLELFTSQGCSSCPPADALLKKLTAENPQLLPLSFHVDYWNNLGWKDPYSSQASTQRQRGYASALDGQVYTPELVVNGEVGVIGSDETRVRRAITDSATHKGATQARMITNSRAHTVNIVGSPPQSEADVWEINYHPYVRNHVERSENSGRMLEHVNSVSAIKHLGTWSGQNVTYTFDSPANPDDRTVILVQSSHYGPIIGASLVAN